MGRIKTDGRGFEFSRREIEVAWADTKAELEELMKMRKARSKENMNTEELRRITNEEDSNTF